MQDNSAIELPLLTLQQAAQRASVAEITARRYSKSEWCEFVYRIGPRIKVSQPRLDEWMKTKRQGRAA